MIRKKQQTEAFYNNYWPNNIPDYKKTREHILSLIPKRKKFKNALDAGCGTGVCTISLAHISEKVIGIDISKDSVKTAENLACKLRIKNIKFRKADLMKLPFKNDEFDLVLSWGVIHHTDNPYAALDELIRVLKHDGILILAVYLKTNLTFLHELVRYVCINTPFFPKKLFIKSIVFIVNLAEKMGKNNNLRNDNINIDAQVEDWFFVPQKHFFTIPQLTSEIKKRRLIPELLAEQTGRFKSSSNFILRGIKKRI